VSYATIKLRRMENSDLLVLEDGDGNSIPHSGLTIESCKGEVTTVVTRIPLSFIDVDENVAKDALWR
jgi:hypothetical protein